MITAAEAIKLTKENMVGMKQAERIIMDAVNQGFDFSLVKEYDKVFFTEDTIHQLVLLGYRVITIQDTLLIDWKQPKKEFTR